MFETDKTLFKKFVNGDERAFAALAEKWQNQILNFAYQYFGDEEYARDVVQEVLIRLYISSKKFRGEAKFSTYLYRIVTNCCIDTIRKNNKLKEVSYENLSPESIKNIQIDPKTNPDTETPIDVVHKNDIGERVRKALLEVPENQRIIMIMKEYSQLTFIEIAEINDIPVSTVKSRMYKGLLNLKSILQKSGIKEWSDVE